MKTDKFLRHRAVSLTVALLVGLVVTPSKDHLLVASQRSPLSEGSSQRVEEPIVIPMELLGNRPMVRAKVNGQGPFALLVNPEAQTTVIDQTLAAELDPKQLRYRSGASHLDVDMEIGPSKLPKLSVSSTDTAKGLPAPGPSARHRGIISASLWPSHLVTIDYRKYQVTVEPGILPEPNQQDVFSLKPESPEFNIRVVIGDRAIPCQLDPLFSGGLLLPQTFASSVRLIGKLGEPRLLVTPKGRAFVREGQIAGAVTVGMFELAKPLVQFADSGEDCIIGGDWLRTFSITYDLANARVKLARQH